MRAIMIWIYELRIGTGGGQGCERLQFRAGNVSRGGVIYVFSIKSEIWLICILRFTALGVTRGSGDGGTIGGRGQ